LCLKEDRLKTATSYLIIIQTLEPLSVASRDTIRLLQMAMDAGNYEVHTDGKEWTGLICVNCITNKRLFVEKKLGKELVRFLNSIDRKFS
jgi:hypothetical protein